MKKITSNFLIIIGIAFLVLGFVIFNPSKKNDNNNQNDSSNNNKINKIKLKCDALLDVKEIDVYPSNGLYYFITNSNDGYVLSLTNTYENEQNCKKISTTKVTNIIDSYFVSTDKQLYNFEDFAFETNGEIYTKIYLEKDVIDDNKFDSKAYNENNGISLNHTIALLKTDGKIYKVKYKVHLGYDETIKKEVYTYNNFNETVYLSHPDEKIINMQFAKTNYRPYYKTDKAIYTYIDNEEDFCYNGSCYVWATPYYEKGKSEAKYEKNEFYTKYYNDILFITEKLDSKNYSYISKDGYHIEVEK